VIVPKWAEYVIHTASPYVADVDDPQTQLVDPAVEGALNVLQACERSTLDTAEDLLRWGHVVRAGGVKSEL